MDYATKPCPAVISVVNCVTKEPEERQCQAPVRRGYSTHHGQHASYARGAHVLWANKDERKAVT